MKTAKLPCGCKYEVGEREHWTELCLAHKTEADETHARWAAEHRAPLCQSPGVGHVRAPLDATCVHCGTPMEARHA